MQIKRQITLKLLLSLLFISVMSYSIPSYATYDWDLLCDVYWNGYKADFTKNQSVSGLKLQDNAIDLDDTVPVWCYDAPNVKTGDESHIGLVAQTQTTAGNTLALYDPVSGGKIPFTICMGTKGVSLLCVNQLNSKNTYSWGGGSVTGNTPLVPEIMIPVSKGDPSDPCASESSGCHRTFYPNGPYSNIAHINMSLSDIDKTPIVPGIYSDTIQFLFNGQLASGHWYAPDLDITDENNPSFTLQAVISPDCEIIAAPNVSFNGYISSQMASVQNIQIRCTDSTPYSITFKGSHDSSDATWHQMLSTTNPQDIIQYQMYADQKYTQPWNGQKTLEQTGTGETQTIPIYYKTNSTQQNQPAGTYQDTETLVITY